MLHHIHYLDKKALSFLSERLCGHFFQDGSYTDLVVVCIGTKRYSGDSLGPRVGTRLLQHFSPDDPIHIYGTLENPVHALNLQKTMQQIELLFDKPYIIAVDSCLGRFYKIGTIQLVEAPLQPGGSLDKELPPVGHIHLKGIVNNYSLLNYQVLENTSLTFVQEMAEVMSRVLIQAGGQILPYLKDKRIQASRKTTSSSL